MCESTAFLWLTFYSALPASTQELTGKTFPRVGWKWIIVPKIWASHQCITSHQRLYSTCCSHKSWSFKQPFTKHSQPFHICTAAGAIETIPPGRQLWHETGFGDVQCSRHCYNIFNGTSTLTFKCKGRNKTVEKGRGVWNCLCENLLLILLTRKLVFLSDVEICCPQQVTLFVCTMFSVLYRLEAN